MIENKPVNYKYVKPGDVVIAKSKEFFGANNRPAFWIFVVEADEYDREGLGSKTGFWPAITNDFFVVGDYATISSDSSVHIMEVGNEQ